MSVPRKGFNCLSKVGFVLVLCEILMQWNILIMTNKKIQIELDITRKERGVNLRYKI